MMAHSIHSVAKTLGEMSGWSLSNLELNKLAYLAHMLKLGATGGRAGLVKNVFEAWDYGPVSPALYHKAKAFGAKPVANVFYQYSSVEDPEDRKVLEEVMELARQRTPGRLVAITHWPEGAWYKNYEPGVRGSVIPNEDIFEEYNRRVRDVAAA